MDILISFLSIIIGCFLLYLVCKYVLSFKKGKEKPVVAHNFKIDFSTNIYANDYVERMPQQYKDNSRVLNGSGKMHFTETVVAGSDLVRKETISVLASIGERFS